MLLRRRLRLPPDRVGQRLYFEDATWSTIYRETRVRAIDPPDPALLVVQFRLRLIGTHGSFHRLFRAESILNTPLFAGFPGFHSKLWITDLRTGVYKGIYEWDGPELAVTYAETLVRLLRLLSVKDTVRFHVVPGVRVDEFLRDPASAAPPNGTADARSRSWWLVQAGEAPALAKRQHSGDSGTPGVIDGSLR